MATIADRFAWLHGVGAADPRPSFYAMLVAQVLAACFNDKKGVAWPSQRYIAGLCRLDLRHCQRALQTLIERGFVEVATQGNGRRSNHYVLVTPGDSDACGGVTDDENESVVTPLQARFDASTGVSATPPQASHMTPLQASEYVFRKEDVEHVGAARARFADARATASVPLEAGHAQHARPRRGTSDASAPGQLKNGKWKGRRHGNAKSKLSVSSCVSLSVSRRSPMRPRCF